MQDKKTTLMDMTITLLLIHGLRHVNRNKIVCEIYILLLIKKSSEEN
jgi:hypothetical protein